MNFNKYEDINLFWNDTKELLEKDEWYNCLMIGNCIEGLEKGINDWFMATITDNYNIELIMLYRKPWKLIFYSPTNNYSDEILEFAASEIYKYDKELLGVNSEKSVANKFAKYYCNLSNMKYSVHAGLRILLLENLEDGKLLEDITYRKCTLNDKDTLIKYIQDFMKEALNEECDYDKAEEKFNKYFEKGYYVLEKDNKIVCQANISRIMKYGKCVSSVYTPKEERGKGYAYNLIYRISRDLINIGDKYCVLYTDDSNPISNHVYEKIGYKRKSDWEDIDFIKNNI